MNDFLPFQKVAEYLCNILFTWLRSRHDWSCHSRYSGTLEWTRVVDCLIHRRVFILVVDLFNVIWTQCLSIQTNL